MISGEGRGATVRVAVWSARHPWWAIVGWVGFVLLCVGAGAATGTNRGSIADFRIGEAGRAETIAEAAGLTPPLVEQVLITAPSGTLDPDAAGAAARDVTARMRALPEVAAVGEPVRSADSAAVRVPVTMAGDPDTARRAVGPLEAQTAAVRDAHPDVRVVQTGSASMSAGVNENLGQDLARTEMISLPVTFLILFVVFGAVLAAAIPVLLAVSAFVGSVGLYAVASWVFPDAGGAAVSVVFLLGMAVGVDYALFYLKRVREEQARASGTLSHTAAVEAAAATAGRAVVTSGVAVIASIACLYVVGDVIFSSIATGAILVVAVALASSLTVLPALLVVLGRWMAGRSRHARTGSSSRWAAVYQNARIPWVAGLVSLVTFIVMLVAFGSVPLAAVGVAINLAAVAVSWGVLTLVFQSTWAEDLLGFTSTGFVGSRMPMMIFAILVGLSTDYQIFVVSRIREAVRRGVPTRQAVLDGIAGSASVVTSAAVIMISVFASFLFIDRIELKQAAVGLSVAVLFDAVVLRILILPSVMTLLGERCWWPARPASRQDATAPAGALV